MLRDFLKWSRIPKGLKKEIRYRHIITFEAIMIVKNFRISYNMLCLLSAYFLSSILRHLISFGELKAEFNWMKCRCGFMWEGINMEKLKHSKNCLVSA